MNPITETGRRKLFIGAAIVLAMTLCLSGGALAMYLDDATKPNGSGGYLNPNDGMCVIGVNAAGTMLIDASITNARDCVAWTRSADGSVNLVSMATQAACQTAGGAGNDGYRHGWSTSICYDTVNNRGISRVDLDNTTAMCTSKGGTVVTTGKCVAYGWVYMNRKSDGSLPVTGTGLFTTDGVQASDNLGFCYTSVNLTQGANPDNSGTYTTDATCPSAHNSATLRPAEWPACASSTAGCQTQPSYDAGLGWSWTTSAPIQCRYAYGVRGYIPAAITRADGTQWAINSFVDTSVYSNQGDCLAQGFTWDNWLRTPGTLIKTNASGGDYTGMPNGTAIVKFDALTPIKDGGGNFISGTGAVCTKCHTDQSRSYQERNKPGYIETRHKHAGDSTGPWQTNFTAENSPWGLKGVQCNICHSTARAAQPDLIQVVPAGVAGPPPAGAPISATGHNKTEYGGHVTDVCFHCHGNFPSANPGNLVPVSGGDFTLTGKGLAPIGNQFLNSPHALYTGSSSKVDIGNKSLFGSTFVGYLCRTSNSIGGGSIITTMYQSGVAERIPNLDTTANLDCTNPGNGSATSGAGGFWVREGDVISPVPQAGYPTDTAQGNCMTCHDVHWALASTNPEAEPIRRECTTCHSHAEGEASASGAPQVDLATINHLAGVGTPLEHMATEPAEACEICHMPRSSDAGSFMHLWRISTDAAYTTMGGAGQANTAADGTYTDAAWVDLNHACGQCHGGNGPPRPGIPFYSTAQLAAVAAGMHDSAGVNYPVTFSTAIDPLNSLRVTFDATVDCGGCDPATLAYDWNWGDGMPPGTTDPAVHMYTVAGTYPVTLVVRQNGLIVGTSTRSVTVVANDFPPVVDGTCTWLADSWTMQVQDASSDEDNTTLQVIVDWGDGGAKSNVAPGGMVSKTYGKVGTFTVTQKATDAALHASTRTCGTATPSYFSISGTVFAPNGTTPLNGARVSLYKGGVAQTGVTTGTNGRYTFGSLRPGTYSIKVSRSGYTFANPAIASIPVGPVPPDQNVTATGTLSSKTPQTPVIGVRH